MFHKQRKTNTGGSRKLAPSKLLKAFVLPPDKFSRVIEEYYTSIDTPFALKCLMLYRAGEFKQLVELELDPHQ
jgi:hypothetical protein